MPQFETDLTTEQARRFDQAIDRFIQAELICRPDVDVQLTGYPKGDGVERRAVYLSSPDHLQDFRRRWDAVCAR